MPSYVEGVGPYKTLAVYDEHAQEMAQTAIIYKNEFVLERYDFMPFALMRRDPVVGYKHSTYGSLLARFGSEKGSYHIGSVHLHSGIDANVRFRQIQRIKNQVLSAREKDEPIVFGGDCNFGLPGERRRAMRFLSPEFTCVSRDIGPTLDGRYSENVAHLPNRIGAVCRMLHVPARLRTDQLFVDADSAHDLSWKCGTLPDRVSDHSPVVLTLG